MKKILSCVLALVLALSCLSFASAEEDYIYFDATADRESIAVGETVTLSYLLPEMRSGMKMHFSATLSLDTDHSEDGYSYNSKTLTSYEVPLSGLSGTVSYTLTDTEATMANSLDLSLSLEDAAGEFIGSVYVPLRIKNATPAAPVTCVITPHQTAARLGDTITAGYVITVASGVQLDRVRFWATTGDGLTYIRDLSAMSGTISFPVTGTDSVRFNIDISTTSGWFCDFYSGDVQVLDMGMKLDVTSNWQQIGSDWYYADESGYAVRGVRVVDGNYYYFDPKTCAMQKNGWCDFAGVWYYAGSNGILYTNQWLDEGGYWYYFQYNGKMAASTTLTIDGKANSFDAAGHWTGAADDSFAWKQYGANWRYERPSGSYAVGWWDFDGTWYYFNESNGYMYTGWNVIDGNWYYFTASGPMVTGWQQINGTWYYFEASGAMATGWKNLGAWYYFTDSGAMATGWQQIGGTWYYFAGSGAMVTGWQVINGQWEMFDASGAWLYTWDGQ